MKIFSANVLVLVAAIGGPAFAGNGGWHGGGWHGGGWHGGGWRGGGWHGTSWRGGWHGGGWHGGAHFGVFIGAPGFWPWYYPSYYPYYYPPYYPPQTVYYPPQTVVVSPPPVVTQPSTTYYPPPSSPNPAGSAVIELPNNGPVQQQSGPAPNVTVTPSQPSNMVARAPSRQLFMYPKQGQSMEQQTRDRDECYQWAMGQIGSPSGQTSPRLTSAQTADYYRAMEACLDAHGYSVR